jgi:hypothetical protein
MTDNHNKQHGALKLSDDINEIHSPKVNLIVTKCLSKCKDRSCSGLYSDTLGFGFQVRCICECHSEEGASNE